MIDPNQPTGTNQIPVTPSAAGIPLPNQPIATPAQAPINTNPIPAMNTIPTIPDTMMNSGTGAPTPPSMPKMSGGSNKRTLILFVVLVVILVAGGVMYFMRSNSDNAPIAPNPTLPVNTPTPIITQPINTLVPTPIDTTTPTASGAQVEPVTEPIEDMPSLQPTSAVEMGV